MILNWTDSLPHHHAVAPSMPSLSHHRTSIHIQTHTHTHIRSSTHRSPQTFRKPSSILPVWEWQGQGVRDDNMAAVIPSSRSLGQERHEAEAVSQEKWPVSEGVLCCPIRGLLKPSSATCSGHTAAFLWQTTEEEGGVTRQLIICIRIRSSSVWGRANQEERHKQKQRGNEGENQSSL